MYTERSVDYRGYSLSAICALLPRPLILTGFFRDVLIRHFSQASNIELPEVQRLVWHRTQGRSKILIESVWRWLKSTTQQRPAILVRQNDISIQRIGIGDRLQGPPADMQGRVGFARMMVGSHTLFCLGESAAQAVLLATEAAREVGHFAPLLRRPMRLHRLEVVKFGAPRELAEAAWTYVVPVTVGWAYEDTWTVQEQAPTLHGISLSLILDS
jgi:hypothetical protein